jgi:hypothetical protein
LEFSTTFDGFGLTPTTTGFIWVFVERVPTPIGFVLVTKAVVFNDFVEGGVGVVIVDVGDLVVFFIILLSRAGVRLGLFGVIGDFLDII